jgi:outer membrane protein assembly factor BamD
MIVRLSRTAFASILVGVVATAGCSSSGREDQVLTELANLDKQQIFDKAEALYQEEEYEEARRYFSFLYDTFPNDPLGHKAALRVADTYTTKRDTASLMEARLRYRDFANRYPNDPDRDYALLMVGNTYTARKLRPDRDLTSIQEALGAYQQLVNLYPGSEHADEAQEQIAMLRELMAEHEWLVSQFYYRNKWWLGALWRLEYLRDNYPQYSQMALVEERIAEIEGEIAARRDEFEQQLEERKNAMEDTEKSGGD